MKHLKYFLVILVFSHVNTWAFASPIIFQGFSRTVQAATAEELIENREDLLYDRKMILRNFENNIAKACAVGDDEEIFLPIRALGRNCKMKQQESEIIKAITPRLTRGGWKFARTMKKIGDLNVYIPVLILQKKTPAELALEPHPVVDTATQNREIELEKVKFFTATGYIDSWGVDKEQAVIERATNEIEQKISVWLKQNKNIIVLQRCLTMSKDNNLVNIVVSMHYKRSE